MERVLQEFVQGIVDRVDRRLFGEVVVKKKPVKKKRRKKSDAEMRCRHVGNDLRRCKERSGGPHFGYLCVLHRKRKQK